MANSIAEFYKMQPGTCEQREPEFTVKSARAELAKFEAVEADLAGVADAIQETTTACDEFIRATNAKLKTLDSRERELRRLQEQAARARRFLIEQSEPTRAEVELTEQHVATLHTVSIQGTTEAHGAETKSQSHGAS